MKFINYLSSIAGVDIFPLVSLMIFFIFFTSLIIYAVRADKQTIEELKNIPLQRQENANDNTGYHECN